MKNWPPSFMAIRLCFVRRSGLLQKGAPVLFATAVALAADGDDVAVVEHSVEDGGSDHRIAEDRAPLPDGPVRGDPHGSAFVAVADQMEEQMGGVGFERQIAELVHDQQFRLGEVGELLLEPPLGVALASAATSVVAGTNSPV